MIVWIYWVLILIISQLTILTMKESFSIGGEYEKSIVIKQMSYLR